MPFKKSEDTPKFYTRHNLLKSYWKSIIENVNSSPSQITLAVTWMMHLCAETEEEKVITRLALYTHYRSKLGIKNQTSDSEQEETPESTLVASMLAQFEGSK
jgi:hypothetical protein